MREMGGGFLRAPFHSTKNACSREGKALRRESAADIAVDQSHDQSHIQKETPTHGIQQGSLHPSDVVASPLYHRVRTLLRGEE